MPQQNNNQDYLNIGSIPNIAGLYNNVQRPVDKIIIKENDNKETKITNLDFDNDNDNDNNNDNNNDKLKNKIKNEIEKKNKNIKNKVKKIKRKNNLIYLVILLLIIILGLIIYILTNTSKIKKVRF